jgi:Flp pilus assembly protein TadG
MRNLLQVQTRRCGAIMPLFAILLVPLIGMLAFSIDVGWIALVKTDLQTAADAAALAGAEKLQDLYVQYTSPGQTNQAAILATATTNTGTSACPTFTAEKFAAYNKAGNVNINVQDSDVTFGFMDTSGNWTPGTSGGFPNSINVVARRDNIMNTPVSLFFGRIFGFNTKELQATARATIYSGDVTTLKAISGVNAHILPVALDVNIWNQFYKTGQSPDGNIYLGTNGIPQLLVYPYGPYQGAFGLVDVGPPQNNVPAFRNWIDDGQTPNDINYLISNNMVPVSMDSPKAWKDGPGLKSTLQANFYEQLWVPNLIPLFKPQAITAQQSATGWQGLSVGLAYQPTNNSGGGGQNQTFAIVGLAGVMISQADGSGNSMNISIQPAAVVDPTAVIWNPKPVATQNSQFAASTMITTFISAKLTK